MTGFVGEFECKLDAKGRLMLPSGLKKQLDPAAQENFVVNRGFEGCLVLYPINEWERITAKLRKLNLFVAKNRKFHRQFHNGATPLQPDGAGRVLLPKTLLSFAQIKKDVVVFGYADRFEIWAKDQYEVEMTDGLEDFADLAEEVMGDLGGDDE